jgi:hypothetical protein
MGITSASIGLNYVYVSTVHSGVSRLIVVIFPGHWWYDLGPAGRVQGKSRSS